MKRPTRSDRSPSKRGQKPAKKAAVGKPVNGSRSRPAPDKVEAKKQPRPDAQAQSPAGTADASAPGPHFLVAAVGASAGGWSAFSGLLRAIPPNAPLALLLVQHLAPEHKSILPELLEGITKMPVEAARDQLKLRSGHIYVIPPDAVMTVVDGTLRVRARSEARLSDGLGPVDALFRSVAEVYGQHAVGVVLSGGGNDGAAGAVQIKEAGGVALAQLPEEAEIDGMPRAAMATGAVDAVLPVAEIGEQLTRLAGHPFFRREVSDADLEDELPSAAGDRRRIFQLLRRATGVDFNHYKLPTLTRRMQRRMALHRIAGLGDYVTLLERDSRELHRLQADLLIHVTSFFREPDSFVALAENILPNMLRDRGDSPLRVWVPGCSTGEEAYSLVMVLLESLGERTEHVALQIFGTDVSESTIDQARAGTFPASIAADVSAERLRRFFTPTNGGYRVNKMVRDCCVFARQDLTRDPPFSRLDLIVCRNLLIYLKQPTQRKVMAVFHYALNQDGVLMLGRSETAGPVADLFTIVDKRHQIYSRKPGHARMELEFGPVRPSVHADMPPDVAVRPPRVSTADWDAQSEANRFLLERYAPPALILDAAGKIIKSRGNTGRYLEMPSGDVSFDISKMIRPELLFAVRSVVQEATSSGKAALRGGVRVAFDGVLAQVDLRAIPVGGSEMRQTMLLFEEPSQEGGAGKVSPPKKGADRDAGTNRSTKRIVAGLQADLVDTRQQLQGIIDDLGAANEELQSANEEVLSSNEELQSTNEELDTAKEELQSTNEELSTLNDELHGRNEELSRVNSDLVNLLSNVQIPIVMVSHDLRIRRFTPAAERTLNIIPSDVGRPIGHLRPNFSCPDLESLIAHVIDGITVYDGEVETSDGRKLAIQIRPYKSVNNQIDGAVLALFEVPVARHHQAELVSGLEDASLELFPSPVLVLDRQQRVVKANAAFLNRYGVSATEVQSQPFAHVAGGKWNVAAAHRLLDMLQAGPAKVKEVKIEGALASGKRGPLRFRGRRIEQGGQSYDLVLLTEEDVTDLKPAAR